MQTWQDYSKRLTVPANIWMHDHAKICPAQNYLTRLNLAAKLGPKLCTFTSMTFAWLYFML